MTTALSWIGYIVAFPLLHTTVVNDMAAVLLLVPLLTTAWNHGRLGGWAATGLVLPVQVTLFLFGDHELGWDMVAGVEGAVGLSGLMATAVAAGYVTDRLRGAEENVGATNRLVATVSHEVRNPLTGVIGLTDSLLEQWDELDPAEIRELVSLIATEAHSMEAIVEDLLDFSRLSAGAIRLDPADVDLGELARAIEPDAEGSAVVRGDEGRIAQIIRNLTSNAFHYGGDHMEVEIGAGASTGWLEVRDDGPGVDAEVAPRIFSPFASAGRPGSTGLGLAVSRELARAMGGELQYLRRGGWTVFRLELPAPVRSHSTPGGVSGRSPSKLPQGRPGR
ncbi:MAG: sensor histidine kinase [Actinomycetota bacterium]